MTSELSPAQGAFRFALELAALVGWALTAWDLASGVLRGIAALAAIVVVGALWGTFRVPGDASASGNAPVAVGGRTRLVLELAVLLGAAMASIAIGHTAFGLVLAVLVLAHYALTWPRVRWLLEQ